MVAAAWGRETPAGGINCCKHAVTHEIGLNERPLEEKRPWTPTEGPRRPLPPDLTAAVLLLRHHSDSPRPRGAGRGGSLGEGHSVKIQG